MNGCLHKSTLSPAWVQVLELMQKINFGRLQNLLVRNGEPDLTQGVLAVRTIKLDGDNGARPEIALEDYQLRSETVRLVKHLVAMERGLVKTVEIRHGLPVFVEVEQKITA